MPSVTTTTAAQAPVAQCSVLFFSATTSLPPLMVPANLDAVSLSALLAHLLKTNRTYSFTHNNNLLIDSLDTLGVSQELSIELEFFQNLAGSQTRHDDWVRAISIRHGLTALFNGSLLTPLKTLQFADIVGLKVADHVVVGTTSAMHTYKNTFKHSQITDIAANGKILASGSANATVRVFSAPETKDSIEKQVIGINSKGSEITCSSEFLTDAAVTALALSDSSIYTTTLQSLSSRDLHTEQSHVLATGAFTSLAMEAQMVVAGSSDGTIRVFDLRADSSTGIMLLKGHRNWVSSLCFKSGSTGIAGGLLSTCYDSQLRMWDWRCAGSVGCLDTKLGKLFCVDFKDGAGICGGEAGICEF